nr:hypothetical protein [Tanacetum cinerariifolium]
MVTVNNRRDSVSPPPLAVKPKKGKSQNVIQPYPSHRVLTLQEHSLRKAKNLSPKSHPLRPCTGLPSTLDEGTRKSEPLLESTATHPKDSEGNKQPLDMDITSITPDEGTGAKYQEDQTHSSRLRYQSLTGNKGEPSYEREPDTQPMLMKPNIGLLLPPQEDKPTSFTAPHTEASDIDSSSDKILKKYDDTLPQTEQQLVKYLRKVSRVQESPRINGKSMKSTTINDLYKGLEAITQLLTDITNSIKDDPTTNKKIEEASETLFKISTQTTDILSLVRSFDFSTLQSTVKNIQDHAFKQEEASAAWMKSFTNMAWNLGSRISGLERAQTHIKSNIGQSSSAPSSSVTLTFALTDILANVDGENNTHTAVKDPHSHTEGEGKGIATDNQVEDQRKLVKASSMVRPDLNEPDKEEEIKKAEEEARLNAISKTEVIKVVREEAKKLGIHPKEAITTKAGELFKKSQDAKHEVLKRQHTKKVRKSLELKKHKYDSYMWTISNKLKPKPITDIKIHPKAKPVVITVYRGTDVVKDLMNSLSQRYERLTQIPRKLGIQSALPAPKQAPSQTSGRKQKHMELKPETRIPGLECNRALPKNVSFINNMVIKEPEYEIFFTNEFGDQAFQRWSDIDKVGMKLIAEYPDQEKLKSKKVKLEALGYKMD